MTDIDNPNLILNKQSDGRMSKLPPKNHHDLELVEDMRLSGVSYAKWFSKLSYLDKYKDATPRNTNELSGKCGNMKISVNLTF